MNYIKFKDGKTEQITSYTVCHKDGKQNMFFGNDISYIEVTSETNQTYKYNVYYKDTGTVNIKNIEYTLKYPIYYFTQKCIRGNIGEAYEDWIICNIESFNFEGGIKENETTKLKLPN